METPLELKGPACDATRWRGFVTVGQQTSDILQVLPCSLSEGRIGAHNFANHLPRSSVEGALRRRAHGQRDTTLGAKTDSLRRRFLPRTDSDRLGEHVHCNRLHARFQFAIAAKAE